MLDSRDLHPALVVSLRNDLGTLSTMEMSCAECGCVVDRGIRVAVCSDPGCCCRDLPLSGRSDDVTQDSGTEC